MFYENRYFRLIIIVLAFAIVVFGVASGFVLVSAEELPEAYPLAYRFYIHDKWKDELIYTEPPYYVSSSAPMYIDGTPYIINGDDWVSRFYVSGDVGYTATLHYTQGGSSVATYNGSSPVGLLVEVKQYDANESYLGVDWSYVLIDVDSLRGEGNIVLTEEAVTLYPATAYVRFDFTFGAFDTSRQPWIGNELVTFQNYTFDFSMTLSGCSYNGVLIGGDVSSGGDSDPDDPEDGGGFGSPDLTSVEDPQIVKNVPFVPWLEYNVGDMAVPIVVAASVPSDGSVTRYTWYRTVYPIDGGLPITSAFCDGPQLLPDTSAVGQSSYYCVLQNVLDDLYSLPVPSNSVTIKVLESGAAEQPEVLPDYPTSEEIGEAVGDSFEEIVDKGNLDAEHKGNQFVDDITAVVPDYSQGFMDAMGGLVSALSYDGTECRLSLPPLVFPQIGDLIPEYTLLESQEIDLEGFMVMFPDWLILLVQSLLTVALIVFCFKEFYGTFAYFFTLKGDD